MFQLPGNFLCRLHVLYTLCVRTIEGGACFETSRFIVMREHTGPHTKTHPQRWNLTNALQRCRGNVGSKAFVHANLSEAGARSVLFGANEILEVISCINWRYLAMGLKITPRRQQSNVKLHNQPLATFSLESSRLLHTHREAERTACTHDDTQSCRALTIVHASRASASVRVRASQIIEYHRLLFPISFPLVTIAG